MVQRVGAPRLGGGGYQPRRGESGISKIGRLANIASGFAGILERREQEAHRTAFLESKASLYEGLSKLDADPALRNIGLDERQQHYTDMIEASAGALGETDRAAAAQLRLQGAIWRDTLLQDDRKRDTEMRISQALEARTRLLDESRARLKRVPEMIFNPQTAATGAALAGSIKQDYEEAIADFAPAIQQQLRQELHTEAARQTVAHFLSMAETVDEQMAARAALRSNEDEVQLPDGTSFNLSGSLTGDQLEDLIRQDAHIRSQAYTARNQERMVLERAKQERYRRSANVIKASLATGQQTEVQVEQLLRDPDMPQEVREEVEAYLDRSRSQDARAAGDDPAQLALQDRYLEAMRTASTPEEVDAINERMLGRLDLHGSLMRPVLTAGRSRKDRLSQAAASGQSDTEVTYTRMNAEWKAAGQSAVQQVGDGITDRIAIVDSNPALKAAVHAEHEAIRNAGDALMSNTDGAAQGFLAAVMPMAYAQTYESRLAGMGGEGPSPGERWRAFLGSINSREALESIAAMDDRTWMGFVQAAGIADQKLLDSMVYHDDGRMDPDATLLRLNDDTIRRQRSAYPVQGTTWDEKVAATWWLDLDRWGTARRSLVAKLRKTATEYEDVSP